MSELTHDMIAGFTPVQAAPEARLGAGWLRVARVGWVMLALVALALFFTSLPGYALIISQNLGHGVVDTPTAGTTFLKTVGALASLASAVLSFTLSTLLFWRRFEEPAVAAISFYLLLYSVVMAGVLEAWGMYWVGNLDFVLALQGILLATPTMALLALFPNGRFVPGWMRWVLLASIPWCVLVAFIPSIFSTIGSNLSLLMILFTLWFVSIPAFGIYAQIYRYRKISTSDEREQTKWVLYGFTLWIGFIILSTGPYFYLTNLPSGTPAPWWAPLSEIGWWLSLSILPISLTIAIARHRLWKIDIVINRTLVYGALTLCIILVYMLVVGGLGVLFQTSGSSLITLMATGLAAVLFNPLRVRLQRAVNRLMYGERDDPVAVLSKLGEHLEKTGSPEVALSGIVEAVARALRLPYVAIELGETGGVAAAYGMPIKEAVRLPMIYQGEVAGQLVVTPRSPGETFNFADWQLLENIAHQTGAAARAVKLTADLRHSRQRLVTTREEERRRIRRDLHDGLGPQLASQTLMLDAVEKLLERDPVTAKTLIQDLKSQSQLAIKDIRNLIYDLRPPSLDDVGLEHALREELTRYQHSGVCIDLIAPEHLPSLPAAVELAAYRIIQESVHNVTRHADASTCDVRLALVDSPDQIALKVVVQDDGKGIRPDIRAGVGFQSMRERAEELDGYLQIESIPGKGTCILAYLPFEKST